MDHIICGAVSSDGSRVAFSDQSGLHVYELPAEPASTDAVEPMSEQSALAPATPPKSRQVAEGQAGRKLLRRTVPQDLPTLHELQFRSSSSHLIGLNSQGSLLVVDVDTSAVSNCQLGSWPPLIAHFMAGRNLKPLLKVWYLYPGVS